MISLNIDYFNFSPISASLGGLLVGLAVSLFFFATERNAGVSGILSNLMLTKAGRLQNLFFVIIHYFDFSKC